MTTIPCQTVEVTIEGLGRPQLHLTIPAYTIPAHDVTERVGNALKTYLQTSTSWRHSLSVTPKKTLDFPARWTDNRYMTNTQRIATTITNVIPGSLGALSSHLVAAQQAIDTAQRQLELAQEDGWLTWSELTAIRHDLSEAYDAIMARWMLRVQQETERAFALSVGRFDVEPIIGCQGHDHD